MEPRRDAAPVAVAVTLERDPKRTARLRAVRNGLPDFVPYVRGGPRQAWAQRAVRESIARHGVR